jgi:hypothetical protein
MTRTTAPRGARTDSSLMRAPLEVSVPEIRTSGNGLSSSSSDDLGGGVGSGLGVGTSGTLSTVNARVAVVSLPAASVARTRKTYAPSASGAPAAYVVALAHGPYPGVPWSIEHSTVAPLSAAKPNSGVLSLVTPSGPSVIDSDGGVVSTVNVRWTTASLPLPSLALTRTVCVPSESGVPIAYGLVQAAYAAWSSEHWTVVPASAVKSNDGVVSFVGPAGPESIDNDGAALSTENGCDLVVLLPAASVARTRKK